MTRGLTAVIEGFFALGWFAWGGADAPDWLSMPLAIGSAAALLVLLAGGVLAFRRRGEGTPMRDPAVRRRYNRIVGVEFALAGAGAAILGVTGLADWIAVWVCAVVGAHFLPLARVFGDPVLVALGAALMAVAAAALVVGLAATTAPTTVAGPATGACLVVAGVVTLRSGSREEPGR